MKEPRSIMHASPIFKNELSVSGANGYLKLKPSVLSIDCAPWVVFGGPYPMCPVGFFGVCLLEEYIDTSAGCSLHLPIKDFSIPANDHNVTYALKCTIRHLLVGRQVYVGCAAGWGRTGLFLSLLAKVAGEADPIGFVRQNYATQAVETTEQSEYIERFNVTGLRVWLLWKLLSVQQRGSIRE